MRELEELIGLLAMRSNDEIGDDAFHQMEEELDWLEMAGGGRDGG